MVLIGTVIYKKSIEESTLDLVFAMPLLIKSLIVCDIAGDFDYDSDH